jgi:poly(3-hydroxybutyrate) depolymerase
MTNSISAERLASGGKTHRFVALFTLVIALAILPSGCGRAEQQVGFQVFDNQTRFAIEVGGRRRTGSLHVPLLYEDDKPQALLFALHGAGSSGEEFRALGFDALANELASSSSTPTA